VRRAPRAESDIVRRVTAPPFERTLHARWGDLDSNGHLANTAYLDACVDVRMMFFAEHGFPVSEFARLKVGPVIFRDEIDYFREFRLLEPMRITLALGGASEDGSHFRLVNEFFREKGQLAARLRTLGGWLDLAARKLVAPPAALRDAVAAMPRTADFEWLEPRARAAGARRRRLVRAPAD
jgi:acyl-CoA thioester hydrolase